MKRLRWWRWFLFGLSMRTLYFGPARLDKQSRDIMFRRWLDNEPK